MKLERELTEFERIKLVLLIKAGGHKQQKISKFWFLIWKFLVLLLVDKQINDKERTAAAMENEELLNFLENLIS